MQTIAKKQILVFLANLAVKLDFFIGGFLKHLTHGHCHLQTETALKPKKPKNIYLPYF